MNQFIFNVEDKNVDYGIKSSIQTLLKGEIPVIICIGSDLALGDSLGPLIGEIIKTKTTNAYVYGTLKNPITAKEVDLITKNVKLLHPNSKILVIDAAVGKKEDVGLIKVNQGGIMPGLGVNKNFSVVGDVSIIGIVSQKENALQNLSHNTRLNLVYSLALKISSSLIKYLTGFN